MKKLLTFLFFIGGLYVLHATPNPDYSLVDKLLHACKTHPTNGDITVLFAYTKHAAKEIGGGPLEIKRQVDNGMKLLNEALRNSNIGYEARAIPQFLEVDYDKPVENARELLKQLDKPDGKFNKIHQFRKEKQADIVCLIFEGERKGIANLYGDMMVCNVGTFGDSYVFPHEFGHNLGAVHSNKNGEPYLRTYHFQYRGDWYRTVSNNGGVAIPYFSEDRTITYNFKYQDPNDNYAWKTEAKTVKLGDKNYDNATTMRKQAPISAKFGEALKAVPSVTDAYAARLVDPDKEPVPEGGKVAWEFLDFVYDDQSKQATWTYNASQMYVNKRKDYRVIVLDPFGKEINGFFKQGSMNAGYPQTVNFDFKRFSLPNGYVAEMKQGSKIQLFYTEEDGEMKLQKEIQVGNPIEFVSADDPNFIQSFVVDENNGTYTITYKNTKDNVPFKVEMSDAEGQFGGSSSGRLSKGQTEYVYASPWPEKPEQGKVYKLYINDKYVRTYTVGTGPSNPNGEVVINTNSNSNDDSDDSSNSNSDEDDNSLPDGSSNSNTDDGDNSDPSTPAIAAKDLDGNEYATAELGGKVWMTESLKTTKCAGGSTIDASLFKTDWKERPLYQYAALEQCDVCPNGWRVPTKQDIKDLKQTGMTAEAIKQALNWNWESMGGSSPNLHVQEASLGIYSASDLNEVINYGYGWTVKGGEGTFYGVRCVRDGSASVKSEDTAEITNKETQTKSNETGSNTQDSQETGTGNTDSGSANTAPYTYETVEIGNQIWIVENLRETSCADGATLDPSTFKKDWKDRMLYTSVALEQCNVCPNGFRVPTKDDVKALKNSGLSADELRAQLNWTYDSLGGSSSNLHIQGASLGIYRSSDLKEVLNYGYGWTVKGDSDDFYGVRCVKDK